MSVLRIKLCSAAQKTVVSRYLRTAVTSISDWHCLVLLDCIYYLYIHGVDSLLHQQLLRNKSTAESMHWSRGKRRGSAPTVLEGASLALSATALPSSGFRPRLSTSGVRFFCFWCDPCCVESLTSSSHFRWLLPASCWFLKYVLSQLFVTPVIIGIKGTVLIFS